MSGRDCCLFCGTDSNISTRMGNDKSRSLHVISILHKLLQIPIWECEKYLDFASSSSSSSPPPGTDWLVLCTSCSSMVAQGHDLVQQLDQIHNQLGKIQTTLQNQIANPPRKRKENIKIFDQLKQDISRRRGPDNPNLRPFAKRSFNNTAISAKQHDSSIDDMNLDILVEEIKDEDEEAEVNLDDDDDLHSDAIDIDPLDDKGEGSNYFIESGDDEADGNLEDDECEITDVREPKKPKITKITGNTAPQRSQPTTIKKSPPPQITLPKTGSSTSCTSDSETIEIKEGIRVNKSFLASAKLASKDRPSTFMRKLVFESGLFTLEEIAGSSMTGKASPSNKTADKRPAIDPVRFTAAKDYTIETFGLQPDARDFLEFEKKLANIPGDARKKMRRRKDESIT